MDWNAFDPLAALGGGALIGLAALVLLLGLGRIAGVSGIMGGLLRKPRHAAPHSNAPGGDASDDDRSWRLTFMAGLPLGAYLMAKALGGFQPTVPDRMLIAAGLLVGFGALMGGGCTSGHGICGLARLSPRSLVAVPVFMASAMATVFIARHLIG